MIFPSRRRSSFRGQFLFVADAVCIAGSIVLATAMRLAPVGMSWSAYLGDHAGSLVGIFVLFLLVFYASGMYEREAITRRRTATLLPAVAVGIGLLVVAVLFYARFRMDIGRGILGLAGVLIWMTTSGLRHLFRLTVGSGVIARNALIVGEGDSCRDVVTLLRSAPDAGLKALGVVAIEASSEPALLYGLPVLGKLADLRVFVEAYEVEVLVVAAPLHRGHDLWGTLRPLRYAGVDIMDLVSLHEEIAQEIPLAHIDDEWLMSAAMNNSVIHVRQLKRLLDVALAAAGLVATFPLCLLAAVCIRLDSPGTVLFRQQRAGLEGTPYTLYKFRTMYRTAEVASGAVWASRDDVRVTRVGRWLRRWRIDELPQLVNVLKGEMSLVGPRPERSEFIETLAGEIPFYRERLLVRPGITGWAQIRFTYAASIEAAQRKLQYDLFYIKHMSLLMDLQILLQTFRTMLLGARHSEDETDHLHVLPPSGEEGNHEIHETHENGHGV